MGIILLAAVDGDNTSLVGGETYYRFDYNQYMILHKYNVIKHTKCGVWLDTGYGGKRFVLSGARKRYALPTLEEAKKSFRARKEKQLKILKAQVQKIESAIWEIDNWNQIDHIRVP